MAVIDVSITTIDPPSKNVVLPVTPKTISTVEASSWASAQPLQWSSQILDYQGTRSRVLNIPPITMFADTPEQAIDITTRIATLRSFIYTSRNSTQLGGTNRPTRVLILWPNFFSEVVVLTQVDVGFLHFFEDKTSDAFGRPRAWTLKIKVLQFNDSRRTSEDVALGADGFGGDLGL